MAEIQLPLFAAGSQHVVPTPRSHSHQDAVTVLKTTLREKRGELKPLTGLRGAASWWVVLYHLWPGLIRLFPSAAPAEPLILVGDIGVDIFFVLSGFIITHTYLHRFGSIPSTAEYKSFLGMRLARIYPTHLCFLFVWLGYFILNKTLQHNFETTPDYFSLSYFVQNFVLVQAWHLNLSYHWNYPAWSVSLEWLAYLCFPILLTVLRPLKSQPKIILLVALCTLAPIGANATWQHLNRIACEFTAGMLVYLLLARTSPNHALWGKLSSALAVLLVIALAALHKSHLPTICTLAVIVLLIYSLSAADGGLTLALGSNLMVHLGRISYALYVSHAAAISALHVVLPIATLEQRASSLRFAALLVYLACIMLTAELTYFLIERPAREWLRLLINGKKEVTAPNATIGQASQPLAAPTKA